MKKNLSQLKRQRQNVKLRERNRALRSKLRTSIRKARLAIAEEPGSDKTKEIVADASRTIDKMATKGLLHGSTAARYKSRLAGHYNRNLPGKPAPKISAEQVTEVEEPEEGQPEEAAEGV